MKQACLMLVCASVLLLAGCTHEENLTDDSRDAQQKANAPAPDVATRPVMACPKCGAPQRPYRVTAVTSYYRCSGTPPKFAYHPLQTWERTVKHDDCCR